MENVDYYRANAHEFYARTFDLDLSRFYAPFIALLPSDGHILDAGCGSGRDARAFLDKGYQVTAFDATPELAQLAAQLTGLDVTVMRFAEMHYREEFDGIWANASLLHVPHDQVPAIFPLFLRALKPGGIWYMSFKYGEGQRNDGARLFSDFTVNTFQTVAAKFEELTLVSVWVAHDDRPGASAQRWLNAIVQKSL